MDERVVIVGAGPAGLAAARELGRAGLDPLVLERADAVAASWRARHDHLHLNTHRALSHQPGMRLPRRLGPYVARDDYVAYLERCAAGMRIRLSAPVRRIDPAGAGWALSLDGEAVTTAHAVIATGPDAEPVVPDWPGAGGFAGELLHASRFRNVADLAGRSVLVIGPGNSGTDLMNHLARSKAGQLWLSARGAMNIAPMRLAGIPMHPVSVATRYLPRRVQDADLRAVAHLAFGDLRRYGYPRPAVGAFSRIAADGVTVALDDGFVAALKSGRITMKPAVGRFDGPRVIFADGTACAPDVVICATGYRPGLEALAGHLVRLDQFGLPPAADGKPRPVRPGLWFFGLDSSIYGNMHVRRRQARQLARAMTGARVSRP
jgi:putative flavoprotein involved in K+ transport